MLLTNINTYEYLMGHSLGHVPLGTKKCPSRLVQSVGHSGLRPLGRTLCPAGSQPISFQFFLRSKG